MKSASVVLFGVLLVVAAIDALPASESLLGKVRDKRKVEAASKAAAINAIADVQKPAVPDTKVAPLPAPADSTEKKLQEEPPGVQPEELLQEGARRIKKQVCPKQQNAAMKTQHLAGQDVVLMQNEPIEMTQPKMPMQQQRTFEPVISLGPLSVNSGPAMSSTLHATYASPGFASQGFATPGFASQGYASPGFAAPATSFQITQPAVLPAYNTYQQHRPTYQHTAISLRHPSYVELVPEMVYYDDRQGHLAPHLVAVHDEPMSLYCQPLKAADHGKALPTATVTHEVPADVHDKKLKTVAKTVEPKDEKDVKDIKETAEDQILKVDKIKEEISQLNRAAQKIVEQQEQLTKMQEDHLARSANMGLDSMYPEMRGINIPPKPTFHIKIGHHGFRQNEDLKPETASSAAKDQAQGFYPVDTSYRYAIPEGLSPAYLRSETGFNTPNLFYTRAAPAPFTASPEDVEFFMRMLDMGKKMGVIAKDYQPALIKPLVDQVKPGKDGEKPLKNEDAITDLMQGVDQKGNDAKPASADLEVKVPPKDGKKGPRRDSRSLVMKS